MHWLMLFLLLMCIFFSWGGFAILLSRLGLLQYKLSLVSFLEQGIISRFGSFRVEYFWYYCCTGTGMPNKLLFVSVFILEERNISRFGSIVVEFFWYYCCTVTGIFFMIGILFCSQPFFMFFWYYCLFQSKIISLLQAWFSTLSLYVYFPKSFLISWWF